MEPDQLYRRYQELQRYVGWTDDDAERVHAVSPVLEPRFEALVDDFYEEIERHPDARKVITGDQPQIDRLKGTLIQWLRDLLSKQYDADYVVRRWRVGSRHVEIGLDQVYTNMALSRLRNGLHRALEDANRAGLCESAADEAGTSEPMLATLRSLDKLLDLDLAIIEDAYQAEYLLRRERAERLAAIGQVAGGIAHELRNPLNVIRTSVYYLLNARDPAPQKQAEHLSRIEKQVGLADGVITALSNFARMPLPALKPLSVEPWIRDTLELTALPPDIEVTLDCPASLPMALADLEQMRIVLSNLVRNARDAMPDGGRLTISARDEDGHIDLAVADSGCGIRPEDLSRVMEPLYTTKARGIGLGLAIARAIVDKNEAGLSATSELGRGTTFTLRLRAAEDLQTASGHE
jgi:two-component system, NtrC family, sensor kinase